VDITNRTYPFARPAPFDMPEEFAWLRAHAPVAEVKLASGDPAWLVTRYADVRAALADDRLSRSTNRENAARMDTGYQADKSSQLFTFGGGIAEPPGHTRWRRIVNRAFTQRQADEMRKRIAEHTEQALDTLATTAADRGGPVDLMAEFAYQIPILVISDLLGIPDTGRPEFAALAGRLTRRDGQTSFADFGATLHAIGRHAIGLIVRKRGDLGDDLLSRLIETHDDDESQLSNEELVSTVILLLMAGFESTAVQFGNACYALLRYPDQLARLRDDPALIGTAIDELLRYAQLGTGHAVAKYTTTDIEIGGVPIPAGATVFLSLGSANRDEAVFGPDAERLDIGRTSATKHLAFGSGPHFCLGAALARAELQEAIGRLLDRFPSLRHVGDLATVPLTSNLFTYFPSTFPVTW